MSSYFLSCKGGIKCTNVGGSCIYKVEGWPARYVADNALITIDNIEVNESDIATPIVAVDDYRAIYKFGQGFGKINIVGTIYLGGRAADNSGPDDRKLIDKVVGAFDKLRIANRTKPTKISIASGYSCMAYLTNITIGQADPQFDKLTYVIGGIIAPNSRKSKPKKS